MIDAVAFSRAEDYIWRNARLLDRTLFAYLFLGGPREAVLRALAAYQNDDGGFGNALEPDKRTPTSQPIDVEFALHIIDYIMPGGGTLLTDVPGLNGMIMRACDFLVAISTAEGGVPYALPSIRSYPHAPWWDVPDRTPASLNPTAAILGLLYKLGVQHPWMGPATLYCWQAIAASDSYEYHELMPMITFLEHVPDKRRAGVELQRLSQRILEPGMVAYDVDAPGYVHKPLDWAPRPESYCRRLFSEETLAAHLRALAGRQQPDGSWPISWEPISHTVEVEWRGWVTVQALSTLRAYDQFARPEGGTPDSSRPAPGLS